jgi:hypothetical protein
VRPLATDVTGATAESVQRPRTPKPSTPIRKSYSLAHGGILPSRISRQDFRGWMLVNPWSYASVRSGIGPLLRRPARNRSRPSLSTAEGPCGRNPASIRSTARGVLPPTVNRGVPASGPRLLQVLDLCGKLKTRSASARSRTVIEVDFKLGGDISLHH